MKLKNQKTGEMGIINYFDNQSIVIYPIDENWNAKGDKKYVYHSLAELNSEWEDYEEPKEYWYIDWDGEVCRSDIHDERTEQMKQNGNFFKTEEEAEKAEKKLQAWTRLKDKGFRFTGCSLPSDKGMCICYETDIETWSMQDLQDFKTLFGGEE